MTLPWGGRVPLQSALHRQARPTRSRSRGGGARGATNRWSTIRSTRSMATDYRRFARWSARSTYRWCIQSLVVFERSTQTSSADGRRRLRHRREGVGAGLCADVGDGDGGGRGVASRHPDHSSSALTSGALQRGIATDPLGPSLRSGPDRGLLNPMLEGTWHG